MDAILKSQTAIRWFAAVALFVVIAMLINLLVVSAQTPAGAAAVPGSAGLIHSFGLVAIALTAYSWVLYPMAGGVLVSAVVLLCLIWAWASQRTFALGVDVATLGLLLGVAAVQRRRRSRRFQHLQQVLDDLEEELTVKQQGIAIESQSRDALQKKLSRYLQLQSIAEELSNMTDLSSIAQLAVDRAFSLIGKSDVCLLFLIDQERQELALFASKRRDAIASIRAKHGDQFDRYVLRTHRPLLVNDVRRDFRFTVAISPERTISSVIACPLLLDQSPEGVLRLDSAQPNAYTQDDLRFLDILLDLVSTATTNARLFAQTQQLAMTDGLTGLTLSRPFLEQLTRELTRSIRSREPIAVLMLDVDQFKDYNDAFGHTAGDLILKSIAEVLRAVVPPGGVVARYGGEEFAVLLPRFPRQQASEVAEKIRRIVESQLQGSGRSAGRLAESAGRRTHAGTALAASRASVGVTISIGVAAFPDDAKSELELIRIADQRLYQAKNAGRNLVCSS